jgi:hypothetical protein
MKKTFFTIQTLLALLLCLSISFNAYAQFGCETSTVDVVVTNVSWSGLDDGLILGDADPRFTTFTQDNPNFDGGGVVSAFVYEGSDANSGSNAPNVNVFSATYSGPACTGDPSTENTVPNTVEIYFEGREIDNLTADDWVQTSGVAIVDMANNPPCTPIAYTLNTANYNLSGTVTVTLPPPAPPLMLADEVTVLEGNAATLAVFPMIPGVTYTWYDDLGLTNVIGSGQSIATPTTLTLGDHFFFVQASSPCGVGGASPVTIHVEANPTGPTTACHPVGGLSVNVDNCQNGTFDIISIDFAGSGGDYFLTFDGTTTGGYQVVEGLNFTSAYAEAALIANGTQMVLTIYDADSPDAGAASTCFGQIIVDEANCPGCPTANNGTWN